MFTLDRSRFSAGDMKLRDPYSTVSGKMSICVFFLPAVEWGTGEQGDDGPPKKKKTAFFFSLVLVLLFPPPFPLSRSKE